MNDQGIGTRLALRIVTTVVAGLFFLAGGAKIGGWLDEQFVAWGYSAGFAVLIGVFEVLFAIALLFERSAVWAAFGLMAIMVGAIGTHLAHGQLRLLWVPLGVFVLLSVLAWVQSPDRSAANPDFRRSLS